MIYEQSFYNSVYFSILSNYIVRDAFSFIIGPALA